MEVMKSDLLERMQRDKVDLIKWFIAVTIAYAAVVITAIWAILTFALKQ
jgi:hypothetical protein